jgi:hypothetical protein
LYRRFSSKLEETENKLVDLQHMIHQHEKEESREIEAFKILLQQLDVDHKMV